jgi:hypothetical protein
MNKLQAFITKHPFLTDKTITELIDIDRLCPVLVRCGGCRFTAGAQDIPHLVKCIEAGGDYVRDVSFPVGSGERAADWIEKPQTLMQLPKAEQAEYGPKPPRSKRHDGWDESQCGGVFDGSQVTSDADPGL